MDQEIIEMFREKNRAILITNLKFDIEKNIAALLETVTNIFNLEYDVAIKNISSIFADSLMDENEKRITSLLNQMKLDSYREVEDSILLKKDLLTEAIDKLSFDEESLSGYYELVLNTTKKIQDNIINLKKSLERIGKVKEFELLIETTETGDESYTKQRVSDYLCIRLSKKLEEKLISALSIRDNNLINKAKESYEKYQEISFKTTHNE